MKPSIKFVKREDGVKIAYTIFGKGAPLVCPAPWVTSLSHILEDPFAQEFWRRLAQEVEIISYDKHGCGQSDRNRKDFSPDSELLDLEALINFLKLEKFNLLGSSMAGPTALAYTYRNPGKVSKLILYGSFANGQTLAKDEVKSALISLIKASWGLGSKALADIFLPDANAQEIQSFVRFQREGSSPEVAARLMELTYTLDVTELLSHIKTPTLILHREKDKIISLDHGRHLASEIPNANFKLLRGKLHAWWLGDTNEIIKEIVEFLGTGKSEQKVSEFTQVLPENRIKKELRELSIDESEIAEQATIVFTDIVSSTKLLTKLGDSAAREIFRQHDQIIRDQIKKYKGKELQNLGDGFMLSFRSASAAIKCACEIQREIAKNLPKIKIRIGINTGEIVHREGKHPFGQAVVIASRIVSKAKGDEIIVSDVVKQLTAGSKFNFLDKGWFKLKGISDNIRLHEMSWKNNL